MGQTVISNDKTVVTQKPLSLMISLLAWKNSFPVILNTDCICYSGLKNTFYTKMTATRYKTLVNSKLRVPCPQLFELYRIELVSYWELKLLQYLWVQSINGLAHGQVCR